MRKYMQILLFSLWTHNRGWTYLPCVGTLASKDPTLYILYGSIRDSIKSNYQHDTHNYKKIEKYIYFGSRQQQPIVDNKWTTRFRHSENYIYAQAKSYQVILNTAGFAAGCTLDLHHTKMSMFDFQSRDQIQIPRKKLHGAGSMDFVLYNEH